MAKRKVYKIEVGEKLYWSDRNLWHIVHIFNDGEDTMIVMKAWSKYKQRWMYQVAHRELVDWWIHSKCFKEVNK